MNDFMVYVYAITKDMNRLIDKNKRMKQKKLLLSISLTILGISAMAQAKAVKVESPIVTEKDFVWYTEQKEAWKALTQKDPTNETAWLNYYHAAHYMGWWGTSSDSVVRQVMSEMKQAIPGSYTYNF